MGINKWQEYGGGIPMIAAACAMSFLLLASPMDIARAEEPATATEAPASVQLRLADLEKAFWVCDYTATTHGVESTPIALCTAVYAALKEQKFGGDFAALLQWWRENRDVEYGRPHAAVNVR
jgi:hypothetical protein